MHDSPDSMIKYLYHLPFLSTFDPETLEAESRLHYLMSFNKYDGILLIIAEECCRISRILEREEQSRTQASIHAPGGHL